MKLDILGKQASIPKKHAHQLLWPLLSKRGFAIDINRSELWFFNFIFSAKSNILQVKKKEAKEIN